MKKFIVRTLIVLVVVVILAVLGVGLFLDRVIKSGVESFGPKLTKSDVKLQSVRLVFLTGSGTIKGLVVGNPAGYKTPSAINVGTASLSLDPTSLLSDKIVIRSINVQGPEITFETDFKGNNLSKILANVQEATGGGTKDPTKPQEPAQPTEGKAAKKLQVDEFVISGAKVHVSVTGLVGQAATIPLPDIHLQNLGQGPDGITPGELAKLVLEAIEKGANKAASGTVADIGKGALYLTKDAAGGGTNAGQAITKGLGNLLKKK